MSMMTVCRREDSTVAQLCPLASKSAAASAAWHTIGRQQLWQPLSKACAQAASALSKANFAPCSLEVSTCAMPSSQTMCGFVLLQASNHR